MTGNTFGKIFRITTWGESHGKGIGLVIDGCPPGINIDEKFIQKELDRRKPGQSQRTTQRKEDDKVEIMSGVFEGKTTGTPISMVIKNKDHDSSAYDDIKNVFRPGHADYTYLKKYGIRDYRGGGRSSGRETAARVAGGAIAKLIIKDKGINISSKIIRIGNAGKDAEKSIKEIDKEIDDAKSEGDSVGGLVELKIKGCPAGLGEPVFDKLDAELSKAIMSIGSVKGVEFGEGFNVASLKGSENNDQMDPEEDTLFKTNHSGGILGGISTGQDIIMKIAVKPTASISKEQKTISINGKARKISVKGRHDPCIVPRLVPVAESMVAIVIADHILRQKTKKI